MRHLKKFEELNLDTYLKYGELLKKAGHNERAQKMIDWAKRGQLDDTPDVNLWIKWMNDYRPRNSNQIDRKAIVKGLISDVPIKAKVQMVHVDLDQLKDDYDYHKEENSYPIAMTISFSIDQSELEKIKPMIKHEMENAFRMDVPLEVEIGVGKNWLDAH